MDSNCLAGWRTEVSSRSAGEGLDSQTSRVWGFTEMDRVRGAGGS